MERVKIIDILKEFQEGVDFTIESKKKVIFHNKKIVDYLELQQQGKAKWFYDFIRRFIPSAVCFYEEKENGNCVFTFKTGNNKKDRKQEIEKNFKENTGIDITHHGKNSNGGHVISGKLKNPEIEKQKNELIEESMGKNHVDKSFIDDGKGLTYSVEKKDQDKVIKETYYQPQSEEEKQQIRKRQEINRQKWELEESKKVLEQQTQNLEKSQNETPPNSDKQGQQTEKENGQKNLSQKTDNKDNNNKKVFCGMGAVSLIVLTISMAAVWVKRK